MDKIRIVGNRPLQGEIHISGAKNAALPLMASSLLTDKPLTLTNVPALADITTLGTVLNELGVSVKHDPLQRHLELHAHKIHQTTAPYDLVRKMRASVLVLGPLLARCGEAKVSLPGGCAIGNRPVDLHVRGLTSLGAEIDLTNGYIVAKAPHGLKGTTFQFPIVSVTGTENLMMAAVLARGRTILMNAAHEPEVVDLALCLNKMGAKIQGAGTDTIEIEGVDTLQETTHSVVVDRIEAGSYAVAASITRGNLHLQGVSTAMLPSFIPTLESIGVKVQPTEKGLQINATSASLQGVNIKTEPFPGFATDLQAQMMSLLTLAQGASLITETIFENRFMHVPELCRMGADITVEGHSAMVKGVSYLKGAPVMATDLRASMSLVLAGLAAQGETIIQRVYHLDRGYENVEEKLIQCGALIERIYE